MLGSHVRERFCFFLEHRRAPLFLALVAFVLTLPALWAGFAADDYLQRIVLLNKGDWGALTNPVADLFSFAPTRLRPLMEEKGYLPWGVDPGINIALARPLTALSHMLDTALWPDLPALQHIHSMLWYALGVGLVVLLYRRVHRSALVAGLAGLLFAVDDAHSMVVGWLANRNALLCLVFGVAMLHFHLNWRKDRRAKHLTLALGCFVVGLLCGEATLGAAAYIVAWQVTRGEGTWFKRLLPVLPYALVVVVWRLVYDALGYGVSGSSLYVDPGRQPLRFAGALVERLPLLLSAQWLEAPVDVWLVLSRSAQIGVSMAAGALAMVLLWLLWSVLKTQALARFWGLGMILSLIPLCAAFPMDRLLMFAGIGGFGLLAVLAQQVQVWPWPRPVVRSWRRPAVGVLLAINGPLAALLLPVRIATIPTFASLVAWGSDHAPRGPEVASQTFVFVNGNDMPVVYTHVIRTSTGEAPAPLRVCQLASGTTSSTLRRSDQKTVVIRTEAGFFANPFDRLMLSPERRFAVGERIRRPDFVAQIRAITADALPLEVAFVFRCSLEDPSLRWLYWNGAEGLQDFPLPVVGEQITIRGGLPSLGFMLGSEKPPHRSLTPRGDPPR